MADERRFLLHQPLLLRSEHRAWSRNSNPSDEESGGELEMLHSIAPDQRACSAEACFAVHGYAAWLSFADSQELIHDLVRRRASVDEEEICVLDAVL